MTEYWVSKQQYFCKYCEIFIRDDKPSRQQHESGMRHKGNLDRYIRSIHKKGERADREAAKEAAEIAKINAAAAAAHARDVGPTPSASSSTSASKEPRVLAKWQGGSNISNYSDARSLGFVDEAAEEATKKAEEERVSQGVMGNWEAVRRIPPRRSESAVQEEAPSGPVAEDKRRRTPSQVFVERTIEDLDAEAPWLALELKVKRKRGPESEIGGVKKEEAAGGVRVHGVFGGIRLGANGSAGQLVKHEEKDRPNIDDLGAPEASGSDIKVVEALASSSSAPPASSLYAADAEPPVLQTTENPAATTSMFKKRKVGRGQARGTALM